MRNMKNLREDKYTGKKSGGQEQENTFQNGKSPSG